MLKAKNWGPGGILRESGYPAAVVGPVGQTLCGPARTVPLIGHLCCCMTWAMRSLHRALKDVRMSGCDVMLVVVGLLLEVGKMENIRKSRETIGRSVCWETLLAMKLF